MSHYKAREILEQAAANTHDPVLKKIMEALIQMSWGLQNTETKLDREIQAIKSDVHSIKSKLR